MFVKLFLSHYLSFAAIVLSCCYCFFMLGVCTRGIFKAPAQQRTPFVLLLIFVIGLLFNYSCHIFSFILREVLSSQAQSSLFLFAWYLAWGLYITTIQAFALFFEYFYQKRLKLSISRAIHGLINIGLSGQFLYLAFARTYGLKTFQFEATLIKVVYCYLFIVVLQLLYGIFTAPKPRIISNQMRYLNVFLVVYLLLELAIIVGVNINLFGAYLHSFDALIALLDCSAVYAMSRMCSHFLRQDVESKEKFNFSAQFKDILEQLSYATTLKELAHLSQTFFQAAFGIPLNRTRLYLRKMEQDFVYSSIAHTTNIERFIGEFENQGVTETSKLIIRGEVELVQYYEGDEKSRELLDFLSEINAEIFLPIFERNTITAYIIVEQDARHQKLFTHKERDEMLEFATYLSNAITILKNGKSESMHQHQKELAEKTH